MKKIGFKLFDYSQVGVDGSEEWKALATFNIFTRNNMISMMLYATDKWHK